MEKNLLIFDDVITVVTSFQRSALVPLDLWFSDVLSGYRIEALLKIGLISYWKFCWVINFLLESFVRISWIVQRD